MGVVAEANGSLLAGRTIVITGAGRGLGRAYAAACAGAGAAVVVNDLDPGGVAQTVDAVCAAGGDAIGVHGDITETGFADQVMRAAIAVSGRVDGLVNNAGVMRVGPAWAETETDLRLQIGVNLVGTALMGRAALAVMTAQGGGVLVNITSGAQSGLPGRATYAATKGGVSSLTYGWALDAYPFGVRVNALAPVAQTPMYAESGDPADGLADPGDIAPALVYLLSDLGRQHNGQVIRFDGRELTVLGRPGPAAVVRRDRAWTVQQIAEACQRAEMKEALQRW